MTRLPVRDAGRSAYTPTWVSRPAAVVDIRPAHRPPEAAPYRPVFFRGYRRIPTPIDVWPTE